MAITKVAIKKLSYAIFLFPIVGSLIVACGTEASPTEALETATNEPVPTEPIAAEPSQTTGALPSAPETPREPDPLLDLLGTWQLSGDFTQSGGDTLLLAQINAVEAVAEGEETYLATGCMGTQESGGWAPLSMQATYDQQDRCGLDRPG